MQLANIQAFESLMNGGRPDSGPPPKPDEAKTSIEAWKKWRREYQAWQNALQDKRDQESADRQHRRPGGVYKIPLQKPRKYW